MSSRKARAATARETMECLERGTYALAGGEVVSIASHLARARGGTRLYTPDDLSHLVSTPRGPGGFDTRYRVWNCTTLAAARQLHDADAASRPLCLNFASAKNPGGGFLNGSQAQEESLARASGLYACISPVQEYYHANRTCGTSLYTDHMIYSPDVPVFRDDADRFLLQPYAVSIVTSPAVNAGAVLQNERRRAGQIKPTMLARIEKLLALAASRQHQELVLGAWGCGVFKNSPEDVAEWFHAQLVENDRLRGAFANVTFAVRDASEAQRNLAAFQQRFSALAP